MMNVGEIFSLVQDVIYVASRGKTLTPMHVGLASTVHQATRSKSLVQLLNAAGQCASYKTVKKVDTSIAKSEIERWNANGCYCSIELRNGKIYPVCGR